MSTVRLDSVSRWFGNVVAVNDVTLTVGPGVTGLLGPNGAGKSTVITMMAGFLAPSAGTVSLNGQSVWRNEAIYRDIGLVPEREAMYDTLTGWQSCSPTRSCTGWPTLPPRRDGHSTWCRWPTPRTAPSRPTRRA